MKTLCVVVRVVSFQWANALPTGNVMGKIGWATFGRSQRRWPRLCRPQWVVTNEGDVSDSPEVSKWRGIRRICAEHVTENLWTEPKEPTWRLSNRTRAGLFVPIWIESARVRDACCGRTPSGCARPWKLSHPGRMVVCGHSRLPISADECPKRRVRVAIYCVVSTLRWVARFRRRWGARSRGWCVQDKPRQDQKVTIEGSDRHPGTICTLVWLPLLLWALLIPVEGETLTGQASGSMLTHALPRQCM